MKDKRTKENVILEILFDAGVKFDKTDFDLYKTIFDNGFYFIDPYERILNMLDDNISSLGNFVSSPDVERIISKLTKFKEEILEQKKLVNEPSPGMYLKYNIRFDKHK